MSRPASRSSAKWSARRQPGDAAEPHAAYTAFQFFAPDSADRRAIGLVAFAVAIPRVLLLTVLPPLLHFDSDSYFEIAQRLWLGAGFGDLSRRTPLYPLAIWLFGRSPRLGLLPLILLQHLLGIASAVLSYAIARRVFPQRLRALAVLAGVLAGWAIYPAMLEQTVLSEPLFSFLLLAAVYFAIVSFQDGRTGQAVVCGIAIALASLTRPIAAAILLLWVAAFFLLAPRKAARFLAAAGVSFCLLLLPLLIRNERVMGSFALTESLGRNLISVTDAFVDYTHGAQLPIKSIYREFLKEKRGPDAVVVYSAMPALRRATHSSDAELDRALATIAWEGIRTHPFQYLGARFRRLPLLFGDPEPSQSYALYPQTYFPFVEFVGRLDPDLVARSLRFPGLSHLHFEAAERIYRAFALDLTSGWFIAFPLIGLLWLILWNRRGEIWLIVLVLAYLWVGSTLLQPPNARYRLPTFQLEIILAVAGYYAVSSALIIAVRKLLSRWPQSSAFAKLLPGRIVLVAIITVMARTILTAPFNNRVLSLSNTSRWQAGISGGEQKLELRAMTMARLSFPVLHWSGVPGTPGESISADIPVIPGLSYRVSSAYSCGASDCSGAQVRLGWVDEAGASLPGSGISQPLSHRRVDNDLFWDQMEMTAVAPHEAKSARLEVSATGAGDLVVTRLVMQAHPTVFNLWKVGTGAAVAFGLFWLGVAGSALLLLR